MSMVIKTNVQALNASKQLKQMSAASETAARKVASGERIGMAADDTAGMAISEKMQNSARGLTQAVRNVRDANAFFNIADGALQEANDMIKRIHEISIQAANDTLTDEDRKLLTTEVEELVAAVDDIAYHTEYGSYKIFAPEKVEDSSSGNQGAYSLVSKYPINSMEGLLTTTTVSTFDDLLKVTLKKDGEDDYELNFSLSAKLSVVNANYDNDVLKQLFPSDTIDEGLRNTFFGDVVSALQSRFNEEPGLDDPPIVGGEIKPDGTMVLNFSGYDEVLFEQQNAGAIGIGVKFLYEMFQPDGSSQNGSSDSSTLKQLFVQSGANAGNGHTYEWNGFDSKLLTLADAKVDPHSEALATIDKCKYALGYLSNIRTTMGAYSNRLEFSEHIADTSRLNITDANSRIKDADIAKEMMNYTKSNVLQQAATNMLSTANQAPQRVLELLKA